MINSLQLFTNNSQARCISFNKNNYFPQHSFTFCSKANMRVQVHQTVIDSLSCKTQDGKVKWKKRPAKTEELRGQ